MKNIFHSGNVIIAGFVGMILFMCYLVFQCTQHPTQMVSETYYEQELNYQNTINATQNFNQLNQSISFEKNNQQLVFLFPDTINKQLTQTTFSFYNVANSKNDKNILLKKNETGKYIFNLNDFSKGNYKVKMNMESISNNYFNEISISI